SLIIVNDSVLNYFERFGGIGKATSIKYSVDENILIIDSIDIYGNSSFSELSKGVFNERYFFNRDSLVNVETGEKYLKNAYMKQIEKQRKKEKTYFIINGKKYKANKINIRRKFKCFDTIKYEAIPVDKTEAKNVYGISEKNKTFQIIDKQIKP